MSAPSICKGCDECGREIFRVKRIHAGRRFCETCYARLFKLKKCNGCGNTARLPIFDQGALCRGCIVSKPCIRCARSGRPVGKVTPDGPVCNSCAHHFKTPNPCEHCGALSTRLVRTVLESGIFRCCPRCARRSARTCPKCRRHRILTLQADGTLACKKCVQTPTSACGACGGIIPGGRAKECEDCAWGRYLLAKIRLHAGELKSLHIQAAYSAFGQWLAERAGNHRAALGIKKHLALFKVVDERYGQWPPANELAIQLGYQGLRNARIPLLWLQSTQGLQIDTELFGRLQENDRIARILEEIPAEQPLKSLLGNYLAHLLTKVDAKRVKMRSVRISLRAATDVVKIAVAARAISIKQGHIAKVLSSRPGVAAALWGFVAFLNARSQEKSDPLQLNKSMADHNRRTKLEKDLIRLAVAARAGRDVRFQWIKRCLAYFHHQYAADSTHLNSRQDSDGVGYILTWEGREYWVPDPLHMTLIHASKVDAKLL